MYPFQVMKFETLVELMEKATQEHAANEALGTRKGPGRWEWIHYRDLKKMVDEARGGLAALGVQKGDKVAIISNNRVEWVVTAFATYGLGAVLVPMYEAQAPEEWKFILNDASGKVVVAATEAIYQTIRGFGGEVPSLTRVICLNAPSSEPDSFAQLLETGRNSPAPLAPVIPEDQAAQLYTSGTTGQPKGVQLTHKNLSTNVLASCSRFDFGPGDRSLAFLPWAHAFGQTAELYTFIYFGAALAINDEIPNLVANLSEVRPTILVAVPRIFNRIYDGVNKQMAEKPGFIRKLFKTGRALSARIRQGERLSLTQKLTHSLADKLIFEKVRAKFGGRLRFVVSGSAALNTEVAEFIDALGIDVYEGYGLTETSPVVSVNYAGNRRIGSVGKALPGIEIRIDHSATEDSTSGEIIVSGPNVMTGYYNRPEENAQVLLPDGSFRTGDMGYIDRDGFLFITGRIKEQYKLENGKYVVPSPLEEELKLSPYIANVVLYGENKPHNVALVVADVPAIEGWAKHHGIALGNLETNPEVKELLMGQLERYSKSFKGYEKPKDLLIITEDFTTDNGLLTPKLSVKRPNVIAKYGAALKKLYS